jgi:3-oxoacyl-[acyl-carrier-protein] synthase II
MVVTEHTTHGRVVITGMGLCTSLGIDVRSTWESVRAGRIGLGAMSAMESVLPEGSKGGQAKELPAEYKPSLTREARYLRWVIESALRESGALTTATPLRRCTILGTTLHGLRAGGRFLRSDDPGELDGFLANALVRTATAGLGLEGSAITTCSACSSSLGAIALGVTMLESGDADLVVAGGYDPVSEYAWAGFNSLRLVAPDQVRPFARDRKGMMLGEGYAVVVLEREDVARARGARALVAIDGWGESADAHHLTQPDPSGAGAARAIGDALKRAAAQPKNISMIAAHATATPDNDAAEAAAFRAVWGDSLSDTPVVGFKSYLGHTLGGAGAVELILSANALRSGWIPPCATTTQSNIEFEGLKVAPPGGIERRLSRTLNTSLGFGGANTCVILGKTDAADAVDGNRASRNESRQVEEAWITGVGVVLPGAVGTDAMRDMAGQWNHAAEITDQMLSAVLNVRRVRRLGSCVKYMLASVSMALRHAGLEGDALANATALLASTHGSSTFCSDYYSQIVREGVLSANPVLFAEGVPNAAAAHVSTNFGIRGACQTFIGSRTSGLDALAMASRRIGTGACDIVVVGAAEETHATVDRAYRHFLGNNEYFTSPGSAALIVESAAHARARGARPLARLGASTSASGHHMMRQSRGCAAAFDTPSTIVHALASAKATRVMGSSNGTWIDSAESAAFKRSEHSMRLDRFTAGLGDLFATGPIAEIVAALHGGENGPFLSLCTDFTGVSTGIVIEQFERSQ